MRIDVYCKGETLTVQTQLGYLATCKSDFLIKIPRDSRIFEPIYDFIGAELVRGQLVGHIVNVGGEPHFLVTRIVEVKYKNYLTDAGPRTKISGVKSIIVLHREDTRTLDEMPVPEWNLTIDQITCILDEVE